MKPETPVLLMWRGCTLDRDYQPNKPLVTTLLGVVTYARHMDGLSLFDSAGQKWNCIAVSLEGKPITWIHRLATCLFVNPTRSCLFNWGEPRPYELSEVAGLLQHEVAEDDDIITQFHENEEWTNAIAKVQTLKDVLAVYRKLTKP